jgi:hypothetical protein
MGSYSRLFIDKFSFEWKYYVPSFLTFLFKETDFYAIKNENNEEEDYSAIGFKTTCNNSIKILNDFGYTIDFFTEIYSYFYRNLFPDFESGIKYEIETELKSSDKNKIDEKFNQYISSFKSSTRQEEILEFIKLLSFVLKADFKKPPFNKPYKLKFCKSEDLSYSSEDYFKDKGTNTIDFDKLNNYLFNNYSQFSPGVLLLSGFLDSENFNWEYPEIQSLMYTRIFLEAVDQSKEVKLELSDLYYAGEFESIQEIKNLHTSLTQSLVDKVNLYNKVFKSLFLGEEQIREKYIKTRVRELINKSDSIKESFKKGKLLEDLVELLFTSNNFLELVNKNVSTKDEEIDLVVKNNINKPFWIAFNSPCLFIECKNWGSKVGTKEIRDFEIKIQNHIKLVKIGFFVSLNGFSSEVQSELKRAGRDDYHIVIISKEDIQDYLKSNINFFDWLEKMTSIFY